MAEVFINDFGSGHTTTDAIPPLVDGETFHLYFHPDGGSELLRVFATDSHDYNVALPDPVDNEITMQFRSFWGNLYVESYYSGSTPPDPPPERPLYWLLWGLKNQNKRGYGKCIT